jgi:drug/metabolite transporter (DMT)-like permease
MHLKYILIAIFISLLWGISPILLKSLVAKLDKVTILVINANLYFAFILMLGYKYYDTIAKDIIKIDIYDVVKMFLSAVIAGFFGNWIYMSILEDHDSYIITALVSISPLFTLILAYLFTKEKVTLWGAFGTILIILGILMISYNEMNFKLEGF